jgi:hypothetical protein
MPGSSDTELTPRQQRASETLHGLIGPAHTGGRTLCCLVGPQGTGKTVLTRQVAGGTEFGEAKYVGVNELLLKAITSHDTYRELLDFPAADFNEELRRFGNSMRQDVHDWVAAEILPDGLTILDHMELVFTLGMDPVTTWYNDAVGSARVMLVLTGRISGQRCLVGQHTLTRGDQPIVELEA